MNRVEFEFAIAAHARNRMMVRCQRYKNGLLVAEMWVEPHRLQSYSPTGPQTIIDLLNKKAGTSVSNSEV